MSFIALKTFVTNYLRVEKLSHMEDIGRIIEVNLEKGLFLSMITIEIIFVFEFCFEDYCFVGLKCLLVQALQF